MTLIDQGERFVFKPLLYELLNGTAQPWEVAPTFAQLLAPYPVQFVQVRGCFWGGAAGVAGWLQFFAGCQQRLRQQEPPL